VARRLLLAVLVSDESTVMNFYLLRLDDERCIFYSEAPETGDVAENCEPRSNDSGGVRAYLERKYHSVRSVLTESESGVGLRMRRLWEWLHERTSPDESALRRLRHASQITVSYPSSVEEEAARALWMNYLASRGRRHLWWLSINALVAPVILLLLMPIPGPNVIGYWFVYRAVCHAFAWMGVRHAKTEECPTRFLSNTALDSIVGIDEEQRTRLASILGLKHLAPFVKHIVSERHAPLALSWK